MEPFVGEIRVFAGNFAPRGWALCNGQLLPIAQNTALFSLLGTYYGGNGTSNFALPNLIDRAIIEPGTGPGLSERYLGEVGGAANHTLSLAELPAHSHQLAASGASASSTQANGKLLAGVNAPNPPYHEPNGLVPMGPGALQPSGGDQPHENRQPYLKLTFIIALQGVFPPRS